MLTAEKVLKEPAGCARLNVYNKNCRQQVCVTGIRESVYGTWINAMSRIGTITLDLRKARDVPGE